MIKKITFEDILKIWKDHLWKDRKSNIEPQSAMLFLNGHDLKNFNYESSYFAFYNNDTIVGVNSGHLCCDGSYRSRGLFVLPYYRKQGIGTQLLTETIKQGKKENAVFVWSYPRLSSWGTYHKAGFKLCTDWQESETSINAFCKVDL
jgi:GNAT superfamily N-acetyltransferase